MKNIIAQITMFIISYYECRKSSVKSTQRINKNIRKSPALIMMKIITFCTAHITLEEKTY